MNTITIILIIITVIGLIALLIGSMSDNGKISTFGLICAVLGGLILFTYKFLSFVSQF